MYDQRALQHYQTTQVTTSSPVRMVVMLYEGAIRFAREAQEAIEARDIPRKAERINRAIRIIQELANALDAELEPDLTRQLSALYDYAAQELLSASASNDVRPIGHVIRVLSPLLQSWRHIAENGVADSPAEQSAQRPAGPRLDQPVDQPLDQRAPNLEESSRAQGREPSRHSVEDEDSPSPTLCVSA